MDKSSNVDSFGMGDSELSSALSRLHRVSVPSAALDATIVPAIRSHNPARRRVRRAVGLAAVPLAAGVAALVFVTASPSSPPQTVAASVIAERAARAVLPREGHTVTARYVITLGCRRDERCPVAVGIRWTANLHGNYVSLGNIRVKAPGLLGRLTFARNELLVPAQHPDRITGGQQTWTVQLSRLMARQYGMNWLTQAFQSAWATVNSLDVPPQLHALSRMLRSREGGGHLAPLVNFRGAPAYRLSLQVFGGGRRHAYAYVDQRSYLLSGLQDWVCAVAKQTGAPDGPQPCVRWVAFTVALTRSQSNTFCAGLRWPFRWFIDGGSVTGPNRRLAPKCR